MQWKVREDAGYQPHIGFGTRLAIVARHASTRGRPHDREAAIEFLGRDDWRDGAVAAKLTGTGERGRDDDERTTGQAKHAAIKGKRDSCKKSGILFPGVPERLQICSAQDNLGEPEHAERGSG